MCVCVCVCVCVSERSAEIFTFFSSSFSFSSLSSLSLSLHTSLPPPFSPSLPLYTYSTPARFCCCPTISPTARPFPKVALRSPPASPSAATRRAAARALRLCPTFPRATVGRCEESTGGGERERGGAESRALTKERRCQQLLFLFSFAPSPSLSLTLSPPHLSLPLTFSLFFSASPSPPSLRRSFSRCAPSLVTVRSLFFTPPPPPPSSAGPPCVPQEAQGQEQARSAHPPPRPGQCRCARKRLPTQRGETSRRRGWCCVSTAASCLCTSSAAAGAVAICSRHMKDTYS